MTYMYDYMYNYIYTHMDRYRYVCIYIYIYMYLHMCTHIPRPPHVSPLARRTRKLPVPRAKQARTVMLCI